MRRAPTNGRHNLFLGGDMHQGWDVSGRESADAGTLCLVAARAKKQQAHVRYHALHT